MKIKRTLFVILLMAFMICFASCGIPNSSSNTNLQLLRIDTLDNTSISSDVENKPAKHSTRVYASGVEELNNNYVTLVAVIKNEDRASFIDMVVYNSQNKKTVVYNEGNGAYQCSSETVYEDDMWVTNIRFDVNVELTNESFYFEIKEIKFLRNNVNEKADLNTNEIRKKEFTFSSAYYDEVLTRSIDQELKGVSSNFVLDYIEFNLEASTVVIYGNYKITGEVLGDIKDYLPTTEISMPKTVVLSYYENKELKSKEFTIELTYLEHPLNAEGFETCGIKIEKLTIGENIKLSDCFFAYEFIYAEGVKKCEFVGAGSMSLPSTCEEIYGLLDYQYIYINYNGTKDNFYKIKGVNEMLELAEEYTVICSDGKITKTNEYR